MRPLVLALLLVTAVACSDRVPAPTTPTPTPQPGYPPAPVSELPEGVLFVQQPSVGPLLFGPGSDGAWRPYLRTRFLTVSTDQSQAVAWTQEGNPTDGIGILTASGYEEIARGQWAAGTPTFVWSNDSRRLAYAIPGDGVYGDLNVWTLDTETGERRLLTPDPAIYSLLGWTAGGDVLARTPDGLAQLGRTQREIPLPEPGDVVDAAMSPDGQSLAMTVGEYEQSGGSLTYVNPRGIWVLGISHGEWREIVDLADDPVGVQTTGGQAMSWSPDGNRITVHRARMDESGMIADSLSVLDVETGKETLVHKLGWGWESWSPDGRYLAYMYRGNAELGQSSARLGLLGPDSEPREVQANVRQMVWTKDGRLLVDIPARLSLLDPETMEMEEIVTDEGKRIFAEIEVAVWSPSGRYAAVSTPSDQYHRSSLYVVDTEEGTAELFLDRAGFWARAWLRE